MNRTILAMVADAGPSGPSPSGPRTVVIRAADRRPLAIVEVSAGATSRALVVRRFLHGHGALLRYYFQEGEREVEVDAEPVAFEGMLRTRWAGTARQWEIEVNPAA